MIGRPSLGERAHLAMCRMHKASALHGRFGKYLKLHKSRFGPALADQPPVPVWPHPPPSSHFQKLIVPSPVLTAIRQLTGMLTLMKMVSN